MSTKFRGGTGEHELNFYVSDEFGTEYEVVCNVEFDYQPPRPHCTDSDEDHDGYFDVVSVNYKSISDENEVEYKFEDLTPELTKKITDKVDVEAYAYVKS